MSLDESTFFERVKKLSEPKLDCLKRLIYLAAVNEGEVWYQHGKWGYPDIPPAIIEYCDSVSAHDLWKILDLIQTF